MIRTKISKKSGTILRPEHLKFSDNINNIRRLTTLRTLILRNHQINY